MSDGLVEFVVAPVAIESLADAITRATEGEEFASAEIELACRKLTEPEKEIATLVVAGKSSGEIATKLNRAEKPWMHIEHG